MTEGGAYLRQEAQHLHLAADRMLYELELGIERVTALKRLARRMEAQADALDDLAEARRVGGDGVKRMRGAV